MDSIKRFPSHLNNIPSDFILESPGKSPTSENICDKLDLSESGYDENLFSFRKAAALGIAGLSLLGAAISSPLEANAGSFEQIPRELIIESETDSEKTIRKISSTGSEENPTITEHTGNNNDAIEKKAAEPEKTEKVAFNGRYIIKTGDLSYKSDEAYKDFPSVKISMIKSIKMHSKSKGTHTINKRVTVDVSPYILKYAKTYGISPYIIRAVIDAESTGNPGAVSDMGARGLMQLMPDTARSMGVKNLHDPESSIKGGTKYLSILIERYKSLETALAAYNAGPNAVDRYGGKVPPFRETKAYVAKIKNSLQNPA